MPHDSATKPLVHRTLILALAAIGSSASGRAQNEFAGRSFTVPGDVIDVVEGDVTGDGRPDLVFAAKAPDAIGYLPSLGRGSFGSPVLVPLSGVTGVAVAQLNPDTWLDIVATVPGGIAISRGGAGGTFGTPIILSIAGAASDVACGDIDSDGDQDLVVANPVLKAVSILANDGLGGFAPQVNWPTSGALAPEVVAIAHMNADTWLDLVVAGAANLPYDGVALLLNTGLGGFAAQTPQLWWGAYPVHSLFPYDRDGDGDLDVLLATTGVVLAFENVGPGALGVANYVSLSGCRVAAVADLNDDGLEDLTLVWTGGDELRMYLGQVGGGFAFHGSTPVGTGTGRLLATDLDGDSIPDIALCGHEVGLFSGDGSGGLYGPTATAAELAFPLTIGDVNGDGLEDVVTTGGYSGGVNFARVFFWNGQGAFLLGPEVGFSNQSPIRALELAHTDASPGLDIVAVAGANNSRLILFADNGAGGFGLAFLGLTGQYPLALAVGDFDNDSDVDAAVAFAGMPVPFAPPGIALHDGTGQNGMSAPEVIVTPDVCDALRRTDLDGDGDLDLVASCRSAGVVLLTNDGAGNFAMAQLPLAGDSARCLELGDFNGDGKADLVVGGDSMHVLLALGGGAFAAPVTTAAEHPALRVAVADIDLDGRMDVISQGASGTPLSIFNGDGSGGLGSPRGVHDSAASQVPAYLGQRSLAVMDADGDGRTDIVTTNGLQLILHANRDGRLTPATYCEAKLNSLGCLPAIGFNGASSAGASSGFDVHAANVRNNKVGLWMYSSSGRASTPFSGGTLCLHAPVRRSLVLFSAGSSSGSDCSGSFAIDVNAFAAGALGGNPIPALRSVGAAITSQFWGRDPGFAPPNNTTLSDALEHVVAP